jgi:hypothetical protein
MYYRVILIFFFIFIILPALLIAQSLKEKDELERMKLEKISGIEDRAAGTHDASNIGLFFENRKMFKEIRSLGNFNQQYKTLYL